MNNEKVIINFRVYRRTQEHIVLLFNKKNLNSDQVRNIKVNTVEAGTEKEVKFKTDNDIKDNNIKAKDDTTMILINHQENNLDPYSKYRVKISLGTKDVVAQELLVYPYSVLPNRAKDNKENYGFLFAWSSKENCFVKLDGAYTADGKFALLTIDAKDVKG